MKLKTFLLVTTLAISNTVAILLSPSPAEARVCFSLEDGFTVSTGDRFNFDIGEDSEKAYLTGNVPGSRITIRSGPGTEYATDGSYGIAGEDVTALMFGYDSNCQIWYRVRFPASRYEGWIRGDYVGFYHPTGLFD